MVMQEDMAWRKNGTTCDDTQRKHMRRQMITIANMNEKARARIMKWIYTASINHKLNKACRGHYKELIKIEFAVKAFSYN